MTPTPVPATVITAPAIAVQPQSLVVSGGQSATFSVTATSTAPMTYRWSRAGTPIDGATASTYTIPAVQLSDSGASFTVVVSNAGGSTASDVARLTVNALLTGGASAARPFSDQSLWNARPTRFTLGSDMVPTSSYFPNIASGQWSVAAALAANTDPAVSVMGPVDGSGLYIADAETRVAQIVIPHWPASVEPSPGTDGHADIIDVAANRIHSFWQLKKVDGQWRAMQYTWTALDGTGWGTPATYMQGSRAAGVPTIAGVIRLAELDDGQASYKHVLAMSMASNGLAASPAFVFPATAADSDASSVNTGKIPMGSLLMLPTSFDAASITNPVLAKIVATLKTFGARVVDRNGDTPFLIYVENGSNFNLMPNGWDNDIASQLDVIRAALRPVAAVTEWVDAKGVVFTPQQNLNMLSMRGQWTLLQGSAAGIFDIYSQSVIFPANGQVTVQTNSSGRSMPSILNIVLPAGRRYRMTVHATGGAWIQLNLWNASLPFYSGTLTDGADVTFSWPTAQEIPLVTVGSGAQGGGRISATVVPLD